MALGKSCIFNPAAPVKPVALPGLILTLSLLLLLAIPGCDDGGEILTTTTPKVEKPPHVRLAIDYFKGVTEPRSTDWDSLLVDARQLQQDGFNTVALEPPVLITERAGGKPRVILEGAALTTTSHIDSIHETGLAVFLAPTTASPGYQENIAVDDIALARLTEDTLDWATTAEEQQVELFTPLSRCNLALGTEACRGWLQSILPAVRERYHGPIAAKVAADIDQPPLAGGAHDFESLDFHGYDYIMVDIHPWGHIYDEERFRSYVIEVLDRAAAVAARDGLKGVIVGDLRLPRNNRAGADLDTGTWLNEEQQAQVADMVLQLASQRVHGFFYYGWSLAEYGARGYQVEDVLIRHFGGQAATTGDDAAVPGVDGATDNSIGGTTVVDNG